MRGDGKGSSYYAGEGAGSLVGAISDGKFRAAQAGWLRSHACPTAAHRCSCICQSSPWSLRMTRGLRPRIYLAGPEVFLPEARAIGAAKCRLAAEAGLEG